MSNSQHPTEREPAPVQSVDRAITILELLARTEAGITEIAAELGVHKSTASRWSTPSSRDASWSSTANAADSASAWA